MLGQRDIASALQKDVKAIEQQIRTVLAENTKENYPQYIKVGLDIPVKLDLGSYVQLQKSIAATENILKYMKGNYQQESEVIDLAHLPSDKQQELVTE